MKRKNPCKIGNNTPISRDEICTCQLMRYLINVKADCVANVVLRCIVR